MSRKFQILDCFSALWSSTANMFNRESIEWQRRFSIYRHLPTIWSDQRIQWYVGNKTSGPLLTITGIGFPIICRSSQGYDGNKLYESNGVFLVNREKVTSEG